MILLTLPVVLPMVTGAGFDPLWFGIFLVTAVMITFWPQIVMMLPDLYSR